MNIEYPANKKLHNVLLEILDEFVRICNENNLNYFLTGGTLLGAVRHKGFIPWDDDIDLAMPRKDYELFLDICELIPTTNYYVLSYRSKEKAGNYCKHIARFCKSDSVFAESKKNSDSYSGIFIDIWPYDNCILFFVPFQYKLIKIFFQLSRIKSGILSTNKKSSKTIGKIICKLLSENTINNIHKKLYLIFNKKDTKYISFFSGRNGYKKETHKFNTIFPLSSIGFEGKNYLAPNNYDSVLKILYGNYMELPPIEQRQSHSPEYILFE